ncbi:MAG: Crp/Fnr family transcriptional regulator [Alphaproteobacteria bacterium]|nr:MAG: Crp/Fnr family transcriptional regulator [Alphaproteobacteria bacterium]
MSSQGATEAVVGRFPHFRALGDETRRQLAEALSRVDLPSDGVLFRRGAAVDGCYLLEAGALKVSIEDHAGRESWLAILGAGDMVGELGVVDHQPRSATVSALTNCRLWRLPVRDFDRLRQRDADLYFCVVQLICERLRITNLQVCNQRLGLEGRLAQTMLKLARAFGQPLDDGRVLVRYKIAQSRLAEIAGVSRENVNRQFGAWREAGLYEMISRYYCLRAIPQWERLAGDYIPTNTG